MHKYEYVIFDLDGTIELSLEAPKVWLFLDNSIVSWK